MSTITQALLVVPVQLTSADAMYYTTPLNTSAKIGRAVFYNTDTIPHAITVNITNTTSSLVNQFIFRVLAPKETYVSPELAGLVLPPAYMIRGLADLATVVNLVVSGTLTTG